LVLSEILQASTRNEAETRALGRALGGLLQEGDFVALSGPLGAGKTTLSKGICAGLGVAEAVSSPTYLLCHEYSGRVPVLHLDAYFAARIDSLLAEGLAERFAAGTVVLLEWAEQIADWLPDDRLEVSLETLSGAPEERSVGLRACGERPAALLLALADQAGPWTGKPAPIAPAAPGSPGNGAGECG